MAESHVVSLTFQEGYRALATFESVPGGPQLLLDEPPPLGGAAGPNALDMLATAIGNCLAASLLFCLRKSRVEVSGLETTVTTHTDRNAAGRLRVTHVDVDIRPRIGGGEPAKFDRCAGLFEDYCTVTASIREGITVNVTVGQPSPPAPLPR
ncbi:MAG TPA: OsmC family protein [Vicinamibacterales bacterium]|nr:OsmC family protein [Vicinamibacterales bacterium]